MKVNFFSAENHQWKTILPLLCVLVLDVMSFGLILPILQGLLFDPEYSLVAPQLNVWLRQGLYGAVLAAFPIAVIAGTPAFGFLSDRIGRKKVLLISLLGASFGLLLCAASIWYKNIAWLIAGRFLTGLASSSRSIAQAAIIDISDVNTKPLNLSFIAVALTTGMVFGPLLGGVLAAPTLTALKTPALPFIFASVLFLLMVLLLQLGFKETHRQQMRHRATLKDNWRQCWQLLHQPQVKVVATIFFLMEFAWSLYFQSAPLMFAEESHSPSMIGFYIAFMGLSMGLGLSVVFRYLIRYLSMGDTVAYCLFLSCLGFIGITLSGSEFGVWISTIPMTMGIGMAYTALLSTLSDSAAQDIQGWLMGFAGALLAAAWSLSGMMSGFLFAYHALLPKLLPALILLFAMGLFLFYRHSGTSSQSR